MRCFELMTHLTERWVRQSLFLPLITILAGNIMATSASQEIHVLIAMRDFPLLNEYREVLMDSGYVVRTVPDGLSCLRVLRSFMPDILILDMELLWGGCDGVIACLGDELGSSQLPVLLVPTGPVDCSMASSNANRLALPLTPHDLMRKVRESCPALIDAAASFLTCG